VSVFGRLLGRRKVRWTPVWVSFPGTIEDRPALWLIDLGAVEAAPVQGLPLRLDVRAPYRAEAETGLPQDGELGYLGDVAEVLSATAAAAGGAMVGRVSSAGVTRFTAHLPQDLESPLTLPTRSAGTPTVHGEFDPHWAYVRDALTPDERQHSIISDLVVIGYLQQQGDDPTQPRPVEFAAVVDDEARANAAAEELTRAGFSVLVSRDDEGEYALAATRQADVAPPGLHELTWSVAEVVHRHGGSYEGWSCSVVGRRRLTPPSSPASAASTG
jgi:Regulator of ribonuclease activity B/Family of unknown function (DUF695)